MLGSFCQTAAEIASEPAHLLPLRPHLRIGHPDLAAKSLPDLAQSPMSGSFCQTAAEIANYPAHNFSIELWRRPAALLSACALGCV
jgi:hypothetical protein